MEPIVIRDQYGRIRLAFDTEIKDLSEVESLVSSLWEDIGSYSPAQGKKILAREDFYDPALVFNSSDIIRYEMPGSESSIKLIDRQVTGQDWLRITSRKNAHPQRIVFYGLKGGVGRSTALALYAYHLGQKGMNALVVDLDLESPGLSSMLLPKEKLPEYGIVDWYVEDAVGQSEGLSGRISSISPLSTLQGVSGKIIVAPAMQIEESSYLAKLSRVIVDVPKTGGGIERFYERSARLMEELEAVIKPDVVLIDSRAGLHDIAAVSIVGLADSVLFFGTDSTQTWESLRLLFTHWQSRPEILALVRERIKMVYALFPESDQERRKKSYIENSYGLFSSTIYEEIEAGSSSSNSEIFNFDLNNPEAPHFPITISWNSRFLEFSEENLLNRSINDAAILASFGELFEALDRIAEIA
jgi:cellulose biosynthesis protein BcsQ